MDKENIVPFASIIAWSAFCCFFSADAVIKRHNTPRWLFYSMLSCLCLLQIYESAYALSLTFYTDLTVCIDVVSTTAFMCFFTGPFMESYIIYYSKAWEYKEKQICGLVPYYLPILWATTGSGIVMMMCLAFNIVSFLV